VLVQEGKLACGIFHPRWNNVVRDELLLVQEGKLAHTNSLLGWNDVLVLMQ
jgi:hypothetical protein